MMCFCFCKKCHDYRGYSLGAVAPKDIRDLLERGLATDDWVFIGKDLHCPTCLRERMQAPTIRSAVAIAYGVAMRDYKRKVQIVEGQA